MHNFLVFSIGKIDTYRNYALNNSLEEKLTSSLQVPHKIVKFGILPGLSLTASRQLV